MEPLQFAYWLQGFSELNQGPPSPEQWQSIREHLSTVFSKVTPPLSSTRVSPVAPWVGTPQWGGTILVTGDGETRTYC